MTSPIPVSLYCFVAVLFSLSSSSFSLFDKRIGVSVLSQNKISRRYSYIRYGTGNSLHGIEIKGGGGGGEGSFRTQLSFNRFHPQGTPLQATSS